MKFKDALEIAVSTLRGVRVPSLNRGADRYERDEAARLLQQGIDAISEEEKQRKATPSLFPEDPYR